MDTGTRVNVTFKLTLSVLCFSMVSIRSPSSTTYLTIVVHLFCLIVKYALFTVSEVDMKSKKESYNTLFNTISLAVEDRKGVQIISKRHIHFSKKQSGI